MEAKASLLSTGILRLERLKGMGFEQMCTGHMDGLEGNRDWDHWCVNPAEAFALLDQA